MRVRRVFVRARTRFSPESRLSEFGSGGSSVPEMQHNTILGLSEHLAEHGNLFSKDGEDSLGGIARLKAGK
jgi:hypothetical protein